MSDNYAGEKFLHKIDSSLHTSSPVEWEQLRRKRAGEETSQKPHVKIAHWLQILERTHIYRPASTTSRQKIRNYYFQRYTIETEEIPSYWQREYGEIQILMSQEDSLEHWFNFLISSQTQNYPMWVKYWIFTGLVKLSRFDKKTGRFRKRRKDTIAPFPEINKDVLGSVVQEIISFVIDPGEKQHFHMGFGKLYAIFLTKHLLTKKTELKETEGHWIEYTKGSSHVPLLNSILGYNTGWCLTSEIILSSMLRSNNFHIYYSRNSDGEAVTPRAAIVTSGTEVTEVRGCGIEQNLESCMVDIVEKKLLTLGKSVDQFLKLIDHMKYLNLIEDKHKCREELIRDDIRFLWELDFPINGMGMVSDPRIEEIRIRRNFKSDMSIAFRCTEKEIGTTTEEAMRGGIKYFHGDLFLKEPESLRISRLPEIITGDLILLDRTESGELTLPRSVGGSLDLRHLVSCDELELPEQVGGRINLKNLKEVKTLKFPDIVNRDVKLDSLEKYDRLLLPRRIRGSLYLKSLEYAPRLLLPEQIDHNLDLRGLKSFESITMPLRVGRYLNMKSLSIGIKLEKSRSSKVPFAFPAISACIKPFINTEVNGKYLFKNLTSYNVRGNPEFFHKKRVEEKLNQGRILLNNGSYQEAIKCLKAMVEEYSNFDCDVYLSMAYKDLGDAYKSLQNLDESLSCYIQSVNLGSINSDLFYQYASVLCGRGEYTEALEKVNRSIELQSDYAEARNLKGIILESMGRFREGIESYREGLAIEHSLLVRNYSERSTLFDSDIPGNSREKFPDPCTPQFTDESPGYKQWLSLQSLLHR